MQYISKKDIKIPKRNKDSHKGVNGKVLVIGGSPDYVGALALAGLAALRTGTDWVTVVAPEKVGWAINCLTPDLVVKKIKADHFDSKHVKKIIKLEESFNAVLIGNGLGTKAAYFTEKYVKQSKKPKVIDADAIKSVASDGLENCVITPHNKELEILLINSKIDKLAIKKIINEKDIRKKSNMIRDNLKVFLNRNNIILLKGKVDIIISKDQILFNKTGNAGMTKAGTGDVLAGICTGFLAQGLSLMQSAVNAAYFNGLIGDILCKKKRGFTYLASDMVTDMIKYKNL
ncbi:MAG: NAD(P)H-hydrate dehydratase [Nanoarchaeota archaeon]